MVFSVLNPDSAHPKSHQTFSSRDPVVATNLPTGPPDCWIDHPETQKLSTIRLVLTLATRPWSVVVSGHSSSLNICLQSLQLASPIATKASFSTRHLSRTQLLPALALPLSLPRLHTLPPQTSPPTLRLTAPPQSLFPSVYLFFNFFVIIHFVLRSSLLDHLNWHLPSFDRFAAILLISPLSGHRAPGHPRSSSLSNIQAANLVPRLHVDFDKDYRDTVFSHLWAAFSIFSFCLFDLATLAACAVATCQRRCTIIDPILTLFRLLCEFSM